MPALPLDADRSSQLDFDWNEVGRKPRTVPRNFTVLDETLRDGLQNPSVIDPPIQDKLRILHLMEELGIESATVGLPGSGKRAFEDVLRLCKEVADCRMKIRVSTAGRTAPLDITPMIEIAQRTGVALEVCAFTGSSPIRQYVEQWDVALIARRSAEAIDIAVRAGLPVSFVTEDTTRSPPEVLSPLFRAAIDHGATRLVLSDTVGHATPDGVRNLIRFTKDVVASSGAAAVGIDWHGHNDRGLALENAFCALECGADRVHGTALGIGERAGNAPIELVLLNLRLLGLLPKERDLTRLVEYCDTVARAVCWQIPPNHPLAGRDAFRTATGVHAAAIAKALEMGEGLADRVYSGVPAGMFGRRQEIAIGFMSGASNVAYWLRRRNIDATDATIAAVLHAAKETRRILSDEEVMAIVQRVSR